MASRSRSELGDYLDAVRHFSRNARLYMVHIVGMDMIHGTWEVLFNLYLLALFEPTHGVELFGQHMHAVTFVGLRLAIASVASGIVSLPAGLLSDRIGRKASFILGDGAGAVISLLNVLVVDPVFLLFTPIVSSFAGSLHHVSETAFMAENSTARERVHLFSVGGSLSTAVGIVGSLIAASFPAFVLWFGGQLPAYRAATLIGIALWFLSLIPALMLREEKSPAASARRVSIGLGNIKHPRLVARLVTTGALLSVGYGAALPFMNVFFHEHLHADETEIGTTFATAALFVAVGGLFAPLIASRLGKVRGVTFARLAAVPVVLSLALSPETTGEAATIGLTAAGLAIALRSMLMNVSVPIAEAFAMEVLDPSERATMVGLETAAASLLRAGAVVVASASIANNDFFLPFAITAGCYLLSTGLFWFWFRGHEVPLTARAIVAPA